MESWRGIGLLLLLGIICFSQSGALKCYECTTHVYSGEPENGTVTEGDNVTALACMDFNSTIVPLVNCSKPVMRQPEDQEGFRPKHREDRKLVCHKVVTILKKHDHDTAIISRGCGFTEKPMGCDNYGESEECFCDQEGCNGSTLATLSIVGLLNVIVLSFYNIV